MCWECAPSGRRGGARCHHCSLKRRRLGATSLLQPLPRALLLPVPLLLAAVALLVVLLVAMARVAPVRAAVPL